MSLKGMKRVITLAAGIGIGAACGGIGSAHATFIAEGPLNGNPKSFLFLNGQTDTTTFSANAGRHGTTGEFIWNAVANVPVDVKNGYATIVPSTGSGPLTTITFTPVNDLIWSDFNFRGLVSAGSTVSVSVDATQGGTFGPFDFTADNSGDFHRVGAQSTDGESILSVTISTSDPAGFQQVKQISVSATVPVPTPEPASLVLLGSGLVALGAARRR